MIHALAHLWELVGLAFIVFLDGGRDAPMGPYLSVDTGSLNFGNVNVGSSSTLNVTFYNTGDRTLRINSITFGDPQLTTSALTPFNIAVNGSSVVAVTYTPSGASALNSSMTISSNSPTTPDIVTCTGQGLAAGTQAAAVTPNPYDFRQQKVGTASATVQFTITNTGTVNTTINSITPTAEFAVTGIAPALPATIAPGATVTFNVSVTPTLTGFQTVANGLSIAGTFTGTPLLVPLSYTGFLIQPAFIVNGTAIDCMLAFVDSNSTVTVCKADPTNFNPEEPSSLSRQYDFGFPGFEKNVERVLVRVEDQGNASFTVRLDSVRNGVPLTPVTDNKSLVSASIGRLRDMLFDVVMTADIINITISRTSLEGPVSIVAIIPFVEPRGEVIEGTI